MNKDIFRQESIKRLKEFVGSKRYYHDNYISTQIDKIISLYRVDSILLYLPLSIEVDLQKLIKRLQRRKVTIYVPFIEQESFKMVKYRLPLKKNSSFKVLQSPNSNFRVDYVDMIIVPVIGVDRYYKRVGFGKGMYDRFYEKLKKKPVVLFVQRKRCYTKEVVSSSYDISADFYITS